MIGSAAIAFILRNWQALAIVTVAALALGTWQWDRNAQFAAGREAERSAARERAMELIEKRAQDDAEITDMDAAGLCAELGGKWVHDTCN